METNVQDSKNFLFSLFDTLKTCADALNLNIADFCLLAQDLADSGTELEQITLGELVTAIENATERYNNMCHLRDRLEALRG